MENAANKKANASTKDDKPIDPKSAQCIRIPLHGPPINTSATEPSIQMIENGIVIHDVHKIDIATNDEQIIVQMAEEPVRRTPGHVANANAENDVNGCNGEAVIEVEIDESADSQDEIPLNRRKQIKVLQNDGGDVSSKSVL